jgi:outer membrane protein assembly factor BamE (lipoprotein component of BamABCDE complex)
MKIQPSPLAAQWLLAGGLVLGMASVHAASGYTIRHHQEQMITAGMTADEVRQVIGSPITRVQYRNEPGPTWSYHVADVTPAFPNSQTEFDVSFGANGRVASAAESAAPEFSGD